MLLPKSIAFTSIAINELLLRERQELSCFRKVGTLDDSNSAKGPATTTMALIFDGGNTTSLNPVDIFGKI